MRPSLLIFPNGQVFHANAAAEKDLTFKDDTSMDPEMFERGHHKRLMAGLKNLSAHDVDKIIGVYTVYSGPDETALKLSLTRTLDFNGNDIGRLCTFHFKWLPEMEGDFGQAFGLTPVEIEITRAIISGVSLSELSEQRGRSLATIRTQTKKLLSKIGLKSQTELACIYSGFTQFNSKSVASAPVYSALTPHDESWKDSEILSLPDGRQLHYEMTGPKDGRPVLFFHGLLGGTVMSTQMRKLLSQYHLRFIMPWRPFFGHTSPDGGRRKTLETVAQDTEYLLDHLKIKSCPIVSVIAGSIYAYAAHQHMPNRISVLINTAASIPLKSKDDFENMDASSRVALYLARHTPSLLPMFMRSFIQKVDAGFDEEFVREHYSESPADLDLLFHPEFKLPIRYNFPLQTAQGYMCFVRDIQIQASRWDKKIKSVNCPVTLVHGEVDKAFPLPLVEKFIHTKNNFKLKTVPGAGQLVYFQAPDVVYSLVNSHLDSAMPSP